MTEIAALEPHSLRKRFSDSNVSFLIVRGKSNDSFSQAEAPAMGTHLTVGESRYTVRAKAAVIQGWVSAGRMAPVDPVHLFFTIWAATRTYADFDVQVCAVLDRPSWGATDHARATEHVVSLILRGVWTVRCQIGR